jgi:hypothetical protein
MQLPEPYFMKKDEWYYFDPDAFRYKLTKKAPPEAIKSYEDFYQKFEGVDEE